MKLSPITALLIAGMLSGLVWSRSLHAQQSSAIPDEFLYQAVFKRVLAQERFGDRIDAKGRSSANARSRFRTMAQLTQAEDAALKTVARGYEAEDAGHNSKVGQLRAGLQTPAGKTNASATIAEINRLQAAHTAMVLDHIGQLKARFGPQRFQQFDNYVRAAIAPQVTYRRTVIKRP